MQISSDLICWYLSYEHSNSADVILEHSFINGWYIIETIRGSCEEKWSFNLHYHGVFNIRPLAGVLSDTVRQI